MLGLRRYKIGNREYRCIEKPEAKAPGFFAFDTQAMLVVLSDYNDEA